MNALEPAIVNPVRTKNSPVLPRLAIMVGSRTDLLILSKMLNLSDHSCRSLYNGMLYMGKDFCLAGPLIGASYAVMIMESLLAWGADRILFFGWCGAISDTVKIGDILIPTGAFVDEGTSIHYGAVGDHLARPSEQVSGIIRQTLDRHKTSYVQGQIWSTDAIYRETATKVKYYRQKKAVAVEMELSALLTVGVFRNVQVGSVLVVSDDLSTYKWRPGFRQENFKQSRRMVCGAIRDICQIQ
jgi:uridine phosphorylase